MTHVRPPAVAGMFYPADPGELTRVIEQYMENARWQTPIPKAIVVPHAGYIYSASVAAAAFACIASRPTSVSRVILLGPAHRVALQGIALSSADFFSTPLGVIPIDQAANALIRGLPQTEVVDEAHSQEHSLEVQLPFLQLYLHDFTLVPLVVGHTDPAAVSEVMEKLWGGEETLVIVSTDLSHYHDYETAKELDAETTRAIEELRLQDIGPQQACGCMPLRGLLYSAQNRGMKITTLVTKNSGDTAGPRNQVVGYGAYAVR